MKTDIDGHIVRIVQSEPIKEQAQIQEKLEVLGYQIPQATLSRRLKKLGISKVGDVYRLMSQPVLAPVLKLQMAPPNLIILHTHPGHANSLAYQIDQNYVSFSSKETKDILGTIAGDDTLVIIIKHPDLLEKVFKTLQEEFKLSIV